MYEGNPGKIDFGSSSCEFRVSEGSSYRESTVHCTSNKSRVYSDETTGVEANHVI